MDRDPTHTLVDPDLSDASGTLDWSGSPKPRSNGQKQRGMGRVVNRPGSRAYIKEGWSGSNHFHSPFSLFSPSLFVFSVNPNPKLTWNYLNSFTNVSINSFGYSKHEFVARNLTHTLNRCKSWRLFCVSTVFVHFIWILYEWRFLRLRRSTTIDIRRGSWKSWFSKILLGFHGFRTEFFELPWIYIDSGSIWVLEWKRGMFMCFTCVLIGDLNRNLRTLLDSLLFVASLAWIQG